MMQQQPQTDAERQRDVRSTARQAAAQGRHENEQLAQQLSNEAVKQWQQVLEGLFALPTAAALGVASSTLYAAALIERGFEVIQQSTDAIRNAAEQSRREIERQARERDEERGGDGGRARAEGRGEARA